MKIKPGTKVNETQCATCPFREDGKGLDLGAAKMSEITAYLIKGQNHFCHSDSRNRTICRGGRNYQLSVWHRLGLISEPTDEAVRQAMTDVGLDAKDHI